MDVHSRVASQFNQRPPKLGPLPIDLRIKQSRKASDPLKRPIATNARVKQDEQLRRDMHLAFVDNALSQKAKGISEPFNELVAHFNSKAEPQPTQLRFWLLALSHVVSRLERTHAQLVEAVVNMPWTTMDVATVKSYTVFMGMLLSAKPEYLSLVLGKIAQGFTYQAGLQALDNTLPEDSSTPLTRRVVYDRLHYLLKHILTLIPTLPSTLMPLLSRNFPHKRQTQAEQSTYIRNLLRVSEYCPELSDKILSNIVDRAVQIDVEIQVELEELEEGDPDAIEEHEIFELDPFDTVVGQDELDSDDDEEDSDSDGDFSDLSSEAENMDDFVKEEHVPMNVRHIQDMVKKLDTILSLIFDHFHQTRASVTGGFTEDMSSSMSSLPDLPPLPPITPILTPFASPLVDSSPVGSRPITPPRPSSPQKLSDRLRSQFHALLSIFDRTILRTFQSRYTQFLIFWYTSLDPEFSDTFQGMLVDTVLFQPETPTVTRAAAASYIGSFVSRASFVDRDSVRRVVSVLCHFLSNHLDAVDSVVMSSNGVVNLTKVNLMQNTVFYAVTQAVFLIFCFRWRDLLEDEDDANMVSKEGKKWIKELGNVQRAVNSVLNPLKVCSPNVTRQFARVAHATDFIYCYTILESNKRDPDSTNGIHPSMLGDSINAELNTFFPFDPCKLPKVNAFVEGVYREWSSVAIGDDEDEEEEEDELVSEQEAGGLSISRPPSESDDDAKGIGASFGAMSISPLQPVVLTK